MTKQCFCQKSQFVIFTMMVETVFLQHPLLLQSVCSDHAQQGSGVQPPNMPSLDRWQLLNAEVCFGAKDQFARNCGCVFQDTPVETWM